MAQLIRFEKKQLPNLSVVGKKFVLRSKNHAEHNQMPEFWARCFADGTFATLEGMRDCLFDESYVGWMGDWSPWDAPGGSYTLIIGMLMRDEPELPTGFTRHELPATDAAVSWVKGKESAVFGSAQELTEQAIRESGGSCDNMSWCIEMYNCPRFTKKDENGECILDYIVPLD